MVEFKLTMGGFEVVVNGKTFGHLQKGDGFFTGPTVMREFLVVSPRDLVQIAKKADEVKRHGSSIPVCRLCGGTSNFPGEVFNKNGGGLHDNGFRTCQGQIHCYSDINSWGV